MRPNPPIPGHELMHEGHISPSYGLDDYEGMEGGCRCGAKPPGFPEVSTYAMRKWHREHKAQIREQAKAN